MNNQLMFLQKIIKKKRARIKIHARSL